MHQVVLCLSVHLLKGHSSAPTPLHSLYSHYKVSLRDWLWSGEQFNKASYHIIWARFPQASAALVQSGHMSWCPESETLYVPVLLAAPCWGARTSTAEGTGEDRMTGKSFPLQPTPDQFMLPSLQILDTSLYQTQVLSAPLGFCCSEAHLHI